MRISDFSRSALGFCAAFLSLAGCGGSQSQLAPSGPLQSGVPRASFPSPNARARLRRSTKQSLAACPAFIFTRNGA
jgi:hypothetical protein